MTSKCAFNPHALGYAYAGWLLLGGLLASAAAQTSVDPLVLEAEKERARVAGQLSRATIAIFDRQGEGGGSGVLISSDGYALTNYHVTAPCGPAMKCGLPDGSLYDGVIVGIDPPGDVALIKLLGRSDFPVAEMGDSDQVRMGDWVYVAGNPFLLAEDFTPSVTYGIISGTHRYQYPAGTLLEYADCLQTDASINPGNSGGPLFDAHGRLIGINGRGSFEKRGRVNVGVGYAISINQIKRFLSHLESGRIVDHASLGATVTIASDNRTVVDDILEDSDAFRRGLRYGDQVLRFAGREITSANAFKNALGVLPAGWRTDLQFMRDGDVRAAVVRLAPQHRPGELAELVSQAGSKVKQSDRGSDAAGGPPSPSLPAEVAKFYEERPGYANYWFNLQHQERIWEACRQLQRGTHGPSVWKITAQDAQGEPVQIELEPDRGSFTSRQGRYFAAFEASLSEQLSPPGSGGALAALSVWKTLLAAPAEVGEVSYFGEVPWPEDADTLAECVVVFSRDVELRCYFDPSSGDLIGLECYLDQQSDPCEIMFSDFRTVDEALFPYRWTIGHGDSVFADLTIVDIDRSER